MAGKSKKTRRKTKKPKVVLSSKKVYTMTACIIALCGIFLFISVKLNSSQNSQVTKNSQNKPEMAAPKTQEKPKLSEQKTVKKSEPAVKTPVPAKSSPAKDSSIVPQKNQPQAVAKNTTVSQSQKQVVESSKKNLSEKKSEAPARLPVTSAVLPEAKTAYVASAKIPSQNEKIQEEVNKAKPFDIPAAKNGATVVLIIDDAGRSASNTKLYAALPFPLAIAVLPQQPQTKQCADVVRNGGKELILHQPMQAENLNINPGPGAIRSDMNSYEIAAVVKQNLNELGRGVKGVNNHEGSLITANEIKIGTVLDVCAENGVYFLDSRTTAATKARQAALERDMTIFEKAGPYIDNEISREKMLERMYETLRYANTHGRAIVIGHVDKSAAILPQLLTEMYPYMKQAGYNFATPSTIK